MLEHWSWVDKSISDILIIIIIIFVLRLFDRYYLLFRFARDKHSQDGKVLQFLLRQRCICLPEVYFKLRVCTHGH